MRQSTPAKFSLHCLGRSVNKKAVGVLIHSHTFQVSIPGQVLSNAPCNLIHTVSQNMIVISVLQMNKSILRGLLAQRHITDPGIDLRAFVSSSGFFQTTSPQLSHHLKHLHTSLSIMCLTLFLVRDDFVCATTLKDIKCRITLAMEQTKEIQNFQGRVYAPNNQSLGSHGDRKQRFTCDH